MESNETKKQRGGRREGAGRKSVHGAKTNVNFRIDGDLLDFLNAQPNKGRFINEAIRHYINQNVVSV